MKQKGFTLIELLVVISIIGFISSVILVSLNSSRMKARDARRIADLEQIQKALEFYFDDHGYYPPACTSCSGAGGVGYDCNCYSYSYNDSWIALATALAPYLSKLPKDPINTNCMPWHSSGSCYSYTYGNVGKTARTPQYDLTASLEDTSSSLRCGVKGYRVYFNTQYWCVAFGGLYHNQIYEASE